MDSPSDALLDLLKMADDLDRLDDGLAMMRACDMADAIRNTIANHAVGPSTIDRREAASIVAVGLSGSNPDAWVTRTEAKERREFAHEHDVYVSAAALRDAARAIDKALVTVDQVGRQMACADWLRERADGLLGLTGRADRRAK